MYALTALDSKIAGPLQLEIKKEGQKLSDSTTLVGNHTKTSPATIVVVSKNLSLLCLQHISSWPCKAREGTNNSNMSRKSVPVGSMHGNA